jgi:hypothetical protein
LQPVLVEVIQQAARAYEICAAGNPFPEVDWRQAQFYLAAYDERKTNFWKMMGKMLNADSPQLHKSQAEELKKVLETKGTKE